MSDRRPLQIDVTAWSPAQSNRVLEGTTVELGGDDAILRLAGLEHGEIHIDVRLALPERSLFTAARIVGREPPDLVEVAFRWIDTYERGRLRAFVETLP